MELLLLLSGPVAVGKSAVASELIQQHSFQTIRSGPYLRELAKQRGLGSNRATLQTLGDNLDKQTDYRWLIDDVAQPAIGGAPEQVYWLLDSVRKNRQVVHFKDVYGRLALHVHFTAPEAIVQQRYEERLARGDEYAGNTPYNLAKLHANEVESRSLIKVADIVVDLSTLPPEKAAADIINQWNTGGSHAPSSAD